MIHIVRDFGVVNKAEVDAFLELFWFFDDPVDVGNMISSSSAFSKSSLNIWKFTVHILLKPGLESFEHYFTSMWEECNFMLTNVKIIYYSVVVSETNILDIPFNSMSLHYILMYICSLGQKDPLEEEMANHSSILAWKNPMNWGAWKMTVHGTAMPFALHLH